MKYKQYGPILLAMLLAGNTPIFAGEPKDSLEGIAREDSLISEQAIEVIDILSESQKEVYNVPVKMVNAAKPEINSMGNDALEGNARVSIENGVASYELDFKAVSYTGLYGHLLKLWTYPSTDKMDYSWWNNSEYEKLTDVKAYFQDYGIDYTNGDNNKYSFIKTVAFNRDVIKENSIYIRISVDAMAGFDQAARLDFDWDNAKLIEDNQEYNTESTSESLTEVTTNSSEESTEQTTEQETFVNPPKIKADKLEAKNNESVEIEIEGDKDCEIYYTLDGGVPSVNANKYSGKFTITESNKTVVVNAIAVKGGKISPLDTVSIKFSSSTSGGGTESGDTIQDGKYWLEFNLWNSNIDQKSMGDAAFDNNRKALVTVSGGRAKVEIATNPVVVSGYTSALKDISSSDVNINIDSKSNFTTNTRFDGKEHKFDYITKFSFELDELNKEFVNVSINVPYTPMDNISANEGGYISARLKFSWSSIEAAGANDKLTPDHTTATGSSDSSLSGESLTNYTDEETGIKMEADEFVLPSETVFDIALMNSDMNKEEIKKENKESFDIAKELLEDKEFDLYIIEGKNGAEEVKPSGVVKLYFPIKEENKGSDIKSVIYRINKGDSNTENSKIELEYELSTNKDFYVVTVKEFGLFAIAFDKGKEKDIEVIDDIEALDTVKADNTDEFKDINEHWAKEYILKARDKKIINGIGKNIFEPDATATRAMFVTVLGRLKADTEDSYIDNPFKDISEEDYFYPYVLWARKNNIAYGTKENAFSPNLEITREQAAAMLYSYAKAEDIELKNIYENDFIDEALISPWAREAVTALSKAGIIKGRENSAFDPKGKITRAEMAVMLVNFAEEYGKKEAEEENNVTEEDNTEENI